jgi:hypothetical protein
MIKMSNSKKFVVRDYITYTAVGCKGLGFACKYENCQNQATSELLNDYTHTFILALCDTCLNSVLELIPAGQYREHIGE